MIPQAFSYHRPTTLDEALALMASAGDDARVLAGGQSLLPLMKLGLARPTHLIDLKGIADLKAIRPTADGGVHIGALAPHAAVARSTVVRLAAPMLADAAEGIGDPQVRTRGTLGGSLAHADPAADLPAVLLALEAMVEVRGPHGDREVPVREFLRGPFATALSLGEILIGVRIPPFPGARTAYAKFPHPASGFAVAGAAVAFRLDGNVLRDVRVALTGVAPTAFRATETESMLEGIAWDPLRIQEALAHATNGVEVMGDVFASPEYRRHLAMIMGVRAFQKAGR
jgi:carbon-monoxide dehydrogenase medium subunit